MREKMLRESLDQNRANVPIHKYFKMAGNMGALIKPMLVLACIEFRGKKCPQIMSGMVLARCVGGEGALQMW
jgi:hypothetical protein